MYSKKGYPENGELVVCTITKVQPYSAFAKLDEYENKEGMIHASELQRKWVRNIKTMLKEGRKLVCKVIELDEKAGHISLSVKRVGASQERNKMTEWKNEQKGNDILEQFGKQQKLKIAEVYEKIGDKLLKNYGLLHPTFVDIIKEGASILIDAGVEKKLATSFSDFVKKRIVLPKAVIDGNFELTSGASDGIEQIKAVLKRAKELSEQIGAELKLTYLGAPKYKFSITAEDYKNAEKAYDAIVAETEKLIKKHDGSIVFARKK